LANGRQRYDLEVEADRFINPWWACESGESASNYCNHSMEFSPELEEGPANFAQ